MPIHIEPLTVAIRGYDNDIPKNASLKELMNIPYKFVCTMQLFNETAWLSGFHGTITIADRREIGKTLKDMNIENVKWARSHVQKDVQT